MKKLLIILLALSLASVASATASFDITITGDGSGTDVYVGDVVRVTFCETTSVATGGGFGDFIVKADQYADATSPEVKWVTTFGFLPSITLSANGDGLQAYVTGQNFGSATPTGNIFYYDFKVASDAEVGDKITISDVSGSWLGVYAPNVVSDVVLTVVPEPMTIALLGLGGLFLRRKK